MWIARDKHGELNLFNVKPIRCPITRNKYWVFPDKVEDPEHMGLDKGLFPSITWKDEPLEVTLVQLPLKIIVNTIV